MIEGGKQVNRLEIAIRALSNLAGSKSNDIGVISMVDGKNVLASDAMVQAFDFYSGLVQDGSFHPDSANLAAPEARALFAQNQAAFLIQGSWCISTWEKENPDLKFGVMPMPEPDDGAKGGLPYIEMCIRDRSTLGRLLFNEILPQDLGFVDRTIPGNELIPEVDFLVGKKQLKQILEKVINTHGATKTAEVLDAIKAMGYK